MYKMGHVLQERLPELGLAVKSKFIEREEWYEFEPITGAMYMTCLANHLARLEALAHMF